MPEHHQTQQFTESKITFQKRATPIIQTPLSNPYSIIQRARINPKSLTPADILQLQSTIGNRAVGKLLSEIRNSSKVQQLPIQRSKVPEEEKEPLQGIFGKEPEEETCPSYVQRQEKPEEEESLQGKFETIQRLEPEDEEKIQMKSVVQRQEISEEGDEPVQGKMIGTIQRQEMPEEKLLQKKSENNTGMPDSLKAGVESLSGIDMGDVRVHYNSSKPAEIGALAYTQGTNIHVAMGQERHLPHEAWHVVQQKQGRVKATTQMKGLGINDDSSLEYEADVMGKNSEPTKDTKQLDQIQRSDNLTSQIRAGVVQRYILKKGKIKPIPENIYPRFPTTQLIEVGLPRGKHPYAREFFDDVNKYYTLKQTKEFAEVSYNKANSGKKVLPQGKGTTRLHRSLSIVNRFAPYPTAAASLHEKLVTRKHGPAVDQVLSMVPVTLEDLGSVPKGSSTADQVMAVINHDVIPHMVRTPSTLKAVFDSMEAADVAPSPGFVSSCKGSMFENWVMKNVVPSSGKLTISQTGTMNQKRDADGYDKSTGMIYDAKCYEEKMDRNTNNKQYDDYCEIVDKGYKGINGEVITGVCYVFPTQDAAVKNNWIKRSHFFVAYVKPGTTTLVYI